MALLRGSFTDEEERDKDKQEAPLAHTDSDHEYRHVAYFDKRTCLS